MPRTITGAQLGPQVYLGFTNKETCMVPLHPKMFKPIGLDERSPLRKKPGVGDGLWTSSPTDGISGWAEWCAAEEFINGEHHKWTLIPDPTAELLEVHTYKDLERLHRLYGRSHSLDDPDGKPLIEYHYLDFGLMAERYAGMHLTEEGQWNTRMTRPYDLYGWDCESTLWFHWSFKEITDDGLVIVGRDDS